MCASLLVYIYLVLRFSVAKVVDEHDIEKWIFEVKFIHSLKKIYYNRKKNYYIR